MRIALATRLQTEPNWLADDARRAAETIETAGGAVIAPVSDIPAGHVAVVADPFGNRLVLIDLSTGR